MKNPLMSFEEAVEQYVLADPRYPPEAYYFVRDGFEYTAHSLPEEGKEERFAKERAAGIPMLTGRDLSLGLRDFALEEYGPMAYFTLDRWNLRSTSDFGEIVFNLIKMGRFSQNHGDKKSDFDNVFDFREAFCKPYEN